MKDYLISMFIDNELDLDEKIIFVETVHDEQAFKDEAIDLLSRKNCFTQRWCIRCPRYACQRSKSQLLAFFKCT